MTRPEWLIPLLDWFTANHREMPWRTTPSAYGTWISEAMLQQTQVATVIPYFNRFINQFPSIQQLASADSQAVLKAWEGLGYYSRARNLQKAAQQIMTQFDGQLPTDYLTLQTLPGFGPYIAAAVASIAFGQPVPVVDGNVLRVFARVWGITDDIRWPKTRKTLFDRLSPIIHLAPPATFNQAIMELGALVCTPKSAKCTRCPMIDSCTAFATDQIQTLPVKAAKPPVPHYHIGVGVIWNQCGEILITQRAPNQLLGGLWEFPGGKQQGTESIDETVHRELAEELGIQVKIDRCYTVVKHAYTHFKITLHAYKCQWIGGHPALKSAVDMKWVKPDALRAYPFPKANIHVIDVITQGLPL